MILITSSHNLSLENKNTLAQKLVTKYGTTEFEYRVDERLILGLTIKIGDREYYYNLGYEANKILSQALS